MSCWYLYIVENKFGHFYTGISNDIKRRFAEHQSGGSKCAKALKGKGPLRLVYSIQIESHTKALQAEIWVKKQTRQRKSQLIDGSHPAEFEHQLIPPELAI